MTSKLNAANAYENLAAERVLVVTVSTSSHQFGHVDVRVVRRAVKSVTKYVGTEVVSKAWNDGDKADGYRNTEWSGTKASSYYTESFAYTSQFNRLPPADQFSAKQGEQYAIRTQFKGSVEDSFEAKRILRTLEGWEKFRKESCSGIGYEEEYPSILQDLAKFLQINTFIVSKVRHNDYGNSSNYTEYSVDQIDEVVAKLIQNKD